MTRTDTPPVEILSHDRPCVWCGHAGHYYLPCDHNCGCSYSANSTGRG